MDRGIREVGLKMKGMVRVSWNMLMEINLKVYGLMARGISLVIECI